MDFKCCKTKRSKDNLDDTVEFLKVIAEPNRLKILCILQKNEMCVCEIWQGLDLPQNLVSHHLKVLKDFKLVDCRREQKKMIYWANTDIIKKYHLLLSHFIN